MMYTRLQTRRLGAIGTFACLPTALVARMMDGLSVIELGRVMCTSTPFRDLSIKAPQWAEAVIAMNRLNAFNLCTDCEGVCVHLGLSRSVRALLGNVPI